MDAIPDVIMVAKEQGIEVIRDGNEILFFDPNKFYFRILNKTRYKGKGRPKDSDYDEKSSLWE